MLKAQQFDYQSCLLRLNCHVHVQPIAAEEAHILKDIHFILFYS